MLEELAQDGEGEGAEAIQDNKIEDEGPDTQEVFLRQFPMLSVYYKSNKLMF